MQSVDAFCGQVQNRSPLRGDMASALEDECEEESYSPNRNKGDSRDSDAAKCISRAITKDAPIKEDNALLSKSEG